MSIKDILKDFRNNDVNIVEVIVVFIDFHISLHYNRAVIMNKCLRLIVFI